jgi:plastocyanin
MFRRAGALAAACSAVAIIFPTAASARTKVVYTGLPKGAAKAALIHVFGNSAKSVLQKYSPSDNAFNIQRVTIHAGDSINWVGLSASFHTVDLPGSSGNDIPLVVPGATVTGVKDAAGNPFWFDGHVPSLGFNPKLFAPTAGATYDGTKRIDSGLPVLPTSSNSLKVQFTKPGVYKYFCDIHHGMIGYVVVRPASKPIPSSAQDAATLRQEALNIVLSAKRLIKTKQPAGHVSVGESASNGLELYAMFPATLHVKAGHVVTFSMSTDSREVHTAAFGPAPYLTTLANSVGGPAFAQEAVYPSSPPTLGPITLNPTSHGNGFANTGFLDRDPTTPLPASGRIKFTTPGTYHFICLVHSFMHGTIIVK